MKRYYKKTCKANAVKFNFSCVLPTTIHRQKSEVDSFYCQEMISSDDGHKCIAVVDPIIMLFNQERLNRLGVDTVDKWLQSLEASNSSSLSKLRSQCSDDDLIHMIKSRHIQQPSELMIWMDYMSQNLNEFKDLYAQEVANQESQSSSNSDVNNVKSSNSD